MVNTVKKVLIILTLFFAVVAVVLSDYRVALTIGVMGALMLIDFILIERFSLAVINGKMGLSTQKIIFFLKLPLFIVIILPLYKLDLIAPPFLLVGATLLPIAIVLTLIFKRVDLQDGES